MQQSASYQVIMTVCCRNTWKMNLHWGCWTETCFVNTFLSQVFKFQQRFVRHFVVLYAQVTFSVCVQHAETSCQKVLLTRSWTQQQFGFIQAQNYSVMFSRRSSVFGAIWDLKPGLSEWRFCVWSITQPWPLAQRLGSDNYKMFAVKQTSWISL